MAAVIDIEEHIISMGSGATSASANLSMSSVSNAAVIGMSIIQGGPAIPRRVMCDAYLSSGSPNTVTVDRRDNDDAITIVVYVADFDAAYVDVQEGTYTLSSGAHAVTLASSVDQDKTWIAFGIDANGSGWRDAMVHGYVSSDTVATFGAGYTSTSANGTYYTMEDVDGNVWDCEDMIDVHNGTQNDHALGTTVSSDETFLALSQSTNRFQRQSNQVITAELLDDDTVRWEKSDSAGTSTVAGHIVQLLESGSSVQRGELAFASSATTDTATITAVDLTYSVVRAPIGFPNVYADGTSSTSVEESYCTLEFNSTTEIEGNVYSNANSSRVHWEVIEFAAPGGGPAFEPNLFLWGSFP